MYCKNSGKQIPDYSAFCTYCGASLASEQNFDTQKPYTRTLNTGGIVERSIVTSILLTVLTCGIYSIYWFIRITDEMNQVSGEGGTSGVIAFLLNLVTCGIYGFYWAYKIGEKRDYVANEKGDSKIIYIALVFFGLGIIVYALVQDTLNKAIAQNKF